MTTTDIEELSPTEMQALATLVRETSAAHVSRLYGISRTAVASLVMGTARPGTVAIYRLRTAARAA
jgi:hypothetical protein